MENSENKKALFVIADKLSRQIDEVDLTLANGNVDVVLDFAQCKFITVDGLEWLEELLLRAESISSRVYMKNISPPVYKVFKVSRIDRVLKACGAAVPSGPVC